MFAVGRDALDADELAQIGDDIRVVFFEPFRGLHGFSLVFQSLKPSEGAHPWWLQRRLLSARVQLDPWESRSRPFHVFRQPADIAAIGDAIAHRARRVQVRWRVLKIFLSVSGHL
jgi:hypothetical protein